MAKRKSSRRPAARRSKPTYSRVRRSASYNRKKSAASKRSAGKPYAKTPGVIKLQIVNTDAAPTGDRYQVFSRKGRARL